MAQLNIKQMEMAGVRISKILSKFSGFSQYIPHFKKYPVIAAVNSKLTSKEIIDITTSSGDAVAAQADFFTATSTTLPINKLITVYNTDKPLWNIITSKAYMLALTNAATPVAWDSTAVNGYPYAVRESSGGQTIKTESLQAYVNYLAAAEVGVAGRVSDPLTFTTSGATGTTAVEHPGYITIVYDDTYYKLFKCIYNQLKTTETCPTAALEWSNFKARDALLTLNYMAENLTLSSTVDADGTDDCPLCTTTDTDGSFTTGNSAGYAVATFVTDATTRLATHITELNGLMTANTGTWDAFDTTNTYIRDKVGGRDKFLSVYNKLEYVRAVKPTEYAAIHDTVSNINGFKYIDEIWKDDFIMNLINEGIITFSQANTDLSTTNLRLLKEPGFKQWGAKMPLAETTTNTAWGEHFGDVWFYTAAQNPTWGKMLADNHNMFANMYSIATATATDAGYGWHGTGAASGSGATRENFDANWATKDNMLGLLKAGVSPNFWCANKTGAAADTCTVSMAAGGVIQGATNAATEFASVKDCLLSSQVMDLFRSGKSNLWKSSDALMQDVLDYVCGADAS